MKVTEKKLVIEREAWRKSTEENVSQNLGRLGSRVNNF